MAIDKVVLTLGEALQAKYGKRGVATIDKALRELVRADKRRSIETVVVRLDHAGDMAHFGGAITGKVDARAAKTAIDRVATGSKAHYLLLLGGPDVVPMVPLSNPAYGGPEDDSDRTVPSDLPYACEARYSTNPNRFLGPTRVVGRLPDVMGERTPQLLTQLIRAAARAKPRPRSDYQSCFALSAQAWEASTSLSLTNTFGHAKALHLSPSHGPAWSAAQLAPRVHFINCHGADSAPEYYGQPTGVEEFPLAHEARRLKGKVSAGTIVAAECCYGAQLYHPGDAGGRAGIALAYLADGASAVFGSTTIAYGPSEGNGAADLICQYFVQQVLAGASLGRAVLEARQKFAAARTHLDPFDLKTLMQFYLLGDPSAQPVSVTPHALSRTKAFKQAFAQTQDRTVRQLRRERLEREGRHLARALPALSGSHEGPGEAVSQTLAAMLRESKLRGGVSRQSFEIARPAGAAPRRVHVIKGQAAQRDAERGAVRVVALVATEEDGQLLHVRRLHSR